MMNYHFNGSSGSSWDNPAMHTEGGSFKMYLMMFLSLDNKLRYCRYNNLRLLIGSPPHVESRPATAASRLTKIQSIYQWVKRQRSPAGLLLYTDIDTLFTTPLENVLHHKDVGGYRDDANACVALTTDYPQSSRYQTGVMLIKNDAWSRRMLRDWLVLSQSTISSESEKHPSDQRLWNELIKSHPEYESHVHVLGPRSYFNAFPNHSVYTPTDALFAVSSGSSLKTQWKYPYWDTLKLPRGDERVGQSLIVHFAGVFGGAVIETGTADILVSLLAMRGFVDRHLKFLSLLTTKHPTLVVRIKSRSVGTVHEACDQISDSDAYSLMKNMSSHCALCVDRVYSMFDIEHAEAEANKCLMHIYEASRALLTRGSLLLDALRHSNRAFIRCHY